MKYRDACAIIKQSVSARQAAEALGLSPDRYGRCRCSVHNGENRNLKVFDGDRGYYCYVCHSGGDVIDLVQNTNRSTLKEAVAWLDGAFRLGLEDDARDAQRAAIEAAERRKREQERREQEREKHLEDWLDVQEACKYADQAYEQHRPRKPGDPITDAFRQAAFDREVLKDINTRYTIRLMDGENRDG